MYACILQADADKAPHITLYINDGTWRPISEPKIISVSDFNSNAGLHSVTIALSVTMTRVTIDMGKTTLVDVENTDLIRTSRVGIRASESLFGITKIITEKTQ